MVTLKRGGRRFALAVSVIVFWTSAVSVGAVNGFCGPAITKTNTAEGFVAAVQPSIPKDFRGNLIVLTLTNGVPTGRFAIGPQEDAPDGGTVFQIASLSKWVTAAGVLTLVRDGLIDLDDPVQNHVTRWKLPGDPDEISGVTVRRLLSHTAGLTDGLGYQGFTDQSDIQSLEESLTRAEDAMDGVSGMVKIGQEPGRSWVYSGGGYTLLQLMIEEVTGESFSDAMKAHVLVPIGMVRSSFTFEDVTDGLASTYDETGKLRLHRHYTASAAASLYTTADDMALFLAAMARPASDSGLLPRYLMQEMRSVHARRYGHPLWGLGVVIYVPDQDGKQVIGHEGGNFPATNTSARLHIQSGDGIVVFATGSTGIASRIADDWTCWRTGKRAITALPGAIRTALFIWTLGIVGFAFLAWQSRRSAAFLRRF